MTDLEQRAHDLALSYVQHKKILDYLSEDSLKMIDIENEYYEDYKISYANFLDLLSFDQE